MIRSVLKMTMEVTTLVVVVVVVGDGGGCCGFGGSVGVGDVHVHCCAYGDDFDKMMKYAFVGIAGVYLESYKELHLSFFCCS